MADMLLHWFSKTELRYRIGLVGIYAITGGICAGIIYGTWVALRLDKLIEILVR